MSGFSNMILLDGVQLDEKRTLDLANLSFVLKGS